MKESVLTTRILRALKGLGGFWFKVHGGPYQQAGIPDILGVLDGTLYALEVKLPGRPHPLTDLQRATLDEMHRSGAVAAVVESREEALHLVTVPVKEARTIGLTTFRVST